MSASTQETLTVTTTSSSSKKLLPRDVIPSQIPIIPPGILETGRRRIWTPVAKDWAIFEKYGRETDGAYTQLHVSVAPGGQNAAHWHGSYSETFTATTGTVGIYSKKTGKISLQPGESVTVPPGEVHYFFNPGEEDVEMKIRLFPAREGFEKGLYVLYGLARDGKSANGGIPNSLIDCAVIFAMSDIGSISMRTRKEYK
jgi:mannose-6-phosphate isomerase-like protein (cupin superfamily)